MLIVILIFRRKKAFDGEVLIWYLGGYGLGRFFIEGMRSDQLLLPFSGLPVSQVLSALLVVGAIVAEIVIRRKIKKKTASEESQK